MDKNPKKLSEKENIKQYSVKKTSEDDQENKSSGSNDSPTFQNFKLPLRSSGTYLKKGEKQNSPPPSSSESPDQPIDGLYWTVGEQEYMGEYEEKEEIRPCQSETEETPSSEPKEKTEAEGSVSSEALSNVYAKLSPFTILWAFGMNPKVGLINLTTIEDFEVFYACGHYGVVFNYVMNTMTMYPGHICPITTIDADSTGRWLITADAGEDTVIIIWDKKRTLPVWSLYNVFPGEGVSTAKISQDARYLTAINCNFNYSLKFWRWTYGREEPDGIIELDPLYGRPKHIDFNQANTLQFVITIEYNVTFCVWDEDEKKIKSYTPEHELCKKKLGTLRESLFLDDGHTTLTSTSHGYVIVWCDIKFSEPIIREKPGTIQRNFLKEVKLHDTGIISLRLTDKVIASSSEDGTILCHDQKLRLMYRILNLNATYFSFNIDYISCHYDPFMESYEDSESSSEKSESEVEIEIPERSMFGKESMQSEVYVRGTFNCDIPYPSDYTIRKRAFPMRDLIFMTQTGKIGYLSHVRKKAKYYLYDTETPVLSMDCNPNSSHLTVGYSNGRLALYDYETKKILISVQFSDAITTLKYSHLGHYLIAGFQNGSLMELHPILLTTKAKLDTSKAPISKISLSKNDDLIAFFDQSSTVQVLRKKKGIKHVWTSMGKYVSHYKPIVDIVFIEETDKHHGSRLFTIGQDRMLVEYDIENLEEDKLKILSIIRIEQTAIPCCFTEYTGFPKSPQFLVSNDQYKIKVYDINQQICEKTTLGPTADTPIKFMKIIKEKTGPSLPNRAKMVYATDKHIGLRLLPPTGNPFEGMGIIGHPEKLFAVAFSLDHKYIFTVGINDSTPFMWEVNHGSLEVASHLGGEGLEPFISLIEGGPNGFLFREIEDFFYYAQIIHQGEDPNLDRSVAKYLDLCEVPDLFRALGYYPTEYEVANLLHELKHLNYDKTGEYNTEITFDECVKAYLNHRSVMGISYQDVKNALMSIADKTDPTDILIERNNVYQVLEERAEPMEHAEAVGYLCILLMPKDENNPLPPCMNIDDFVEQVFGIDQSITEDNVREVTHAFENKN